jgi:hypothetical protein
MLTYAGQREEQGAGLQVSGTQFTCFTGTKVQILTLLLLLQLIGNLKKEFELAERHRMAAEERFGELAYADVC